RIAAELSERRPEHLPASQERDDVGPLEADGLACVLTAAAGLDVLDLRAIRGAAVRWIVIQHPPRQAEQDAEAADDEKETAPSEPLCDPEERHAQEPEADVLAEGVDGIRSRPFALRKPRRENPAVRRKAWR